MFCKNCGNELKNNDIFCSNCGTNNAPTNDEQMVQPVATPVMQNYNQAPPKPVQTQPVTQSQQQNQYFEAQNYTAQQQNKPIANNVNQNVSDNKPKKKKGKKGLLIVIILLVVVLAGGGVFGYIMLKDNFNPSNKVMEALDSGDYDAALEYYQELDEVSDSLVTDLNSRLDKVYEDYKNNTIDYATATLEVTTISNMNIKDVSEKLSTVYSKIEELNSSRTAFDTAKLFDADGNYAEAIKQYKLVSEEDSNYETAKTNLSTAINNYRTKALNEATTYANNKDYENALKTLNSALTVLENDADITKQITVYSSTYENECLTKADALLAEKKYDEAQTFLSNASGVLPNSTAISDKLNSIDGLRPVALKDLVLIDSDRYEYKSELFTDSFGYSYDGNHHFEPYSKKFPSYAVFNLNKSYSVLNCSLVAETEMDSNCVITVGIYVDEKLVKTITNFKKTTEKTDITVNVANATKLEFRISADEGYDGDVSLVDAVVSK